MSTARELLPLFILTASVLAGTTLAKTNVALSASTHVNPGLPKRKLATPKPQPTKTHTEESHGQSSEP